MDFPALESIWRMAVEEGSNPSREGVNNALRF
jgi:hypothetical protein